MERAEYIVEVCFIIVDLVVVIYTYFAPDKYPVVRIALFLSEQLPQYNYLFAARLHLNHYSSTLLASGLYTLSMSVQCHIHTFRQWYTSPSIDSWRDLPIC